MLLALLVVLMLALLFGGLAVFVARVFLVGILLAILVGIIMGARGRGGHTHV